jgi:membrane-bound lytic murein transglycosylase D
MWQFMPSTGKVFMLKQNAFRDDRRDVLASTRAALDYLERLGVMFNGDWQLALAAYNWGEGNVKRALQRKRDPKARSVYESLRGMPAETRDYVPKLIAAASRCRHWRTTRTS